MGSSSEIPSMILHALLHWWLWLTAIRMLYVLPGRAFGFCDPLTYRYFLTLWVPWRKPWLAFMVGVHFWRRLTKSGRGESRKWTGPLETVCYTLKPDSDQILVGRFWWHIKLFQPIALTGGERHAAIVATSGGGKTAQLITMIGCANSDQSGFVIDCDGAMVNALGAWLKQKGHKVVKLDPDNLAKGFTQAGSWDPIEELQRAVKRHGPAKVVPFAQALSEAFIIQDSQTQPVFANTVKVFLKALILFLHLFEQEKTILRLRQLIANGLPEKVRDPATEDPFDLLLFEMSEAPRKGVNDGCGGQICEAIATGARVMHGAGTSDKHNAFWSTLTYQTAWMDDPDIRATMGKSDVCGEDLKVTNTWVFLVGTLTDIQTSAYSRESVPVSPEESGH